MSSLFKSKPPQCYKCGIVLEKHHAGSYPLMVLDKDPMKEKEMLNSKGFKFQGKHVRKFCEACFKETSTINFDEDVTCFGPEDGAPIVWGHGGGGSRMMFLPHAKYLAEKYGWRSYLFDFPGHATKVDVECTVENCVQTAREVLILAKEKDPLHRKPMYVGLSFGAYSSFPLLARYSDLILCAALGDCGQNVGPSRGFKASVGLFFMGWLVPKFSNEAIMKAMINAVSANKYLDYEMVLETSFKAGNFFEKAAKGQVNVLKTVAPEDFIPNIPFPIHFTYGILDYHDSQDRWLSLCKNKERSVVKAFDSDHFFSHDKRHFQEYCEEIARFYERELLLASKTLDEANLAVQAS